MEIKVLRKEKNEIEVEFDNLTFVEILRVYLNQNSNVTFVAWKKEHAMRNPVLLVKTKSKEVKAVIEAAVKSIVSDIEGIEKTFKGLK